MKALPIEPASIRSGRFACLCFMVLLPLISSCDRGEQRADPDYHPPRLESPLTRTGAPLVLIDEGHHNFHTRTGRYRPFSEFVESQGFTVESLTGKATAGSLQKARVLVIANALHADNRDRWSLPTPSAFADPEIDAIVEFVHSGGGLFLIADHMPFPGAIDALARRFGVRFANGFVFEEIEDGRFRNGPTIFRKESGRIGEHPITSGIRQVASFTGSAFLVDGNASPLLVLGETAVLLEPETAWEFEQETSRSKATGWYQGAALERGRGRVVVFGEAAMFTAQITRSGGKTGLTSPEAKDNEQLLANILRWLTPERP